ncbi:mechanosensitive ion channel domain-containing protein [Maridesulfovibrio sp.]|uniref:mechanosensitive ion channel family protein n=1 Tax=Maridesulfovibrio sp. TaxID=2795000 RepID=UPI0029C9FA81|nr:mechanosensitive ion channel domain-containing protein [Maridesulfovibrio sp.]
MWETMTNQNYQEIMQQVYAWVQTHVLTANALAQIVIIAGLTLVAILIGKVFKGNFDKRFESTINSNSYWSELARQSSRVIWMACAYPLFHIAIVVFQSMDKPSNVLRIATSLTMAIMVVRVSTGLFKNKTMAKLISYVAYALAILNIFNLYGPTMKFLAGVGVKYGEVDLNVLMVVKGLVLLVLALQLAGFMSRFVHRRIESMEEVSPSLQVLMSKAATMVFFAIAIFISIDAVGLDLSGLAFLSGAMGVGIGFGLRNIFSNLVSGVILLLDKSIKPGDTIEVSGVYGLIRSINARFVSVISRDGKEYLVPNENLIKSLVVNWTYSSPEVRIRIPVGVSYDCDLKQAVKLVEQAGSGVDRVLASPAPAVRLKGFGSDSINMELRVWIRDPEKGLGGVRHKIVMNIWEILKENNIEMPYPQRDLHLKSVSDDISDKLLDKLK